MLSDLFKKFQQKSPKQRFLFILGVFFIGAYFTLGGLILLMPDKVSLGFEPLWQNVFGAALLLYGSFRAYRLMKNNSEYDENED